MHTHARARTHAHTQTHTSYKSRGLAPPPVKPTIGFTELLKPVSHHYKYSLPIHLLNTGISLYLITVVSHFPSAHLSRFVTCANKSSSSLRYGLNLYNLNNKTKLAFLSNSTCWFSSGELTYSDSFKV